MRVLGLISGTSHDGIDSAVVDFIERDGALTGKVVHTGEAPYGESLRSRLIAALPPTRTTLDEVCQLDTLIGQAFAAAADAALIDAGGADAICSHGQTVFHWVDGAHALGTLQIGQPAWIAERTGLPVVSDIRIRDITVDGHGAPLASLIDYLLLRDRASVLADQTSDSRPTGVAAALNLGGISNVSIVSKQGVLAFDIGPANALIDAVVVTNSLNALGYDADAAIARAGTVDTELLAALLSDPYYSLPAPKSTGKEHFHAAYVAQHVAVLGRDIAAPDLLATLTELTVRTVADAILTSGATYLAVSGGGCRNPLIMEGLRRELPGVEIVLTDSLGAPPDAKEAILMALIGWCTLHGVPGIVPGGTGASQPSILGTITPGRGPLRLPEPVGEVTSLRLVDGTRAASATADVQAPSIVLRHANHSDLAGVVDVFLSCWRENYRSVLPPATLEAMTDERAVALWARVLSTDPDSIVVAEREGKILGLTRYVIELGEGMVHSLYVSREAQGSGLGTQLLDNALAFFRDHGVDTVRLWAFSSNTAGIGFYRSRGWVLDGSTRVEDDFGVPECRLQKSVP